MNTKKTAWFVIIRTPKGFRVLSGPYVTFAEADKRAIEVNCNLPCAPFAYARRTASAKMTTEWAAVIESVAWLWRLP